MTWRILIADKLHPCILDLAKEIKVQCDVMEDMDSHGLGEIVHDYHGVILRSKFLFGKDLFDKAKNLKFIARGGAGLDGIDLGEAAKRGVEVVNAPEANSNAVAEHTLGMTLGLLHRLYKSNREVKDFLWIREENRGRELSQMVVGILGYGNMGKAFGKVVQPLAKRTMAFDIDSSIEAVDGVEMVGFEEFCREVQILSIHIHLTDENFQIIDKAYLKGFDQIDFLVNTSRGRVMNLTDIYDLLRREELKGVGLDVLPIENMEKLDQSQKELYKSLFEHPMAIVTPHIAGWSKRSYRKISEILFTKIRNYILQNG